VKKPKGVTEFVDSFGENPPVEKRPVCRKPVELLPEPGERYECEVPGGDPEYKVQARGKEIAVDDCKQTVTFSCPREPGDCMRDRFRTVLPTGRIQSVCRNRHVTCYP
jgi:hypothetical protein